MVPPPCFEGQQGDSSEGELVLGKTRGTIGLARYDKMVLTDGVF